MIADGLAVCAAWFFEKHQPVCASGGSRSFAHSRLVVECEDV